MASVWLLSKRSLQGMDILNVVTDVLYSIEQVNRGEKTDEVEYLQRISEGERLLSKLAAAAAGQMSRKPTNDPYLSRVLEEMEKKKGLRPSEMQRALETAVKEGLSHPTPESMSLLETLSEVVSNLTLRSVEGLSTSLT